MLLHNDYGKVVPLKMRRKYKNLSIPNETHKRPLPELNKVEEMEMKLRILIN